MKRVLGLAIAFTLATPAGAGAADPVLIEATDLGGYALFVNSGAPGMVLAVVRDGQSVVVGYGETEKGNGHAPDGRSLVLLNSITKVFTTEVVVSLVADGKLRLTDPLQRYAGAATVPKSGPHPMTLLDLATHSAGLPREMGVPPPGINARAWPTRDQRWAWLPGVRLAWGPGTVAAYSNIGFDFLADAAETAGGQPYPELLRARVTAPLGMSDTGFAPTAEQCARLMVGSGLGGAATCVDTAATDGSGGLYSTGNDMAVWLRHNLDDPDGTLALSHAAYRPRQSIPAAIGFDEGGPMAGLGLGWVTVAADGIHPALIAKSGAGLGFMSYAVFAPGRHVGAFIVVNRADFGAFAGLTAGANGLVASLATR